MEPDEEAHLLDMTFECLSPQFRAYVPSYAEWLARRGGQEPYDYLRRLLQYLQWQDGGALGQEVMELWTGETQKYLSQRDALGDTVQIMDVNYLDIVKNGAGVAQEIYARRGQVVSPEALDAFSRWEEGNPHQHGTRNHTLETYGLTPAGVREAFAPYIERFSAVL